MSLSNGLIMNLECPVSGNCLNEDCVGKYDSIQGVPFAKDEYSGRFQCGDLTNTLDAKKLLKDSEFMEQIGGGSI